MTTHQVFAETTVPRPDAGFGIIGAVVALVLLSVGILSLSSVMTQSISMETIITQRTSAHYISRSAMEMIRATDPLAVTAQALVVVNEQGVADANGAFSREVTVTDVGRNLIEVTVIVTVPRGEPIRLMTWIYNGTL